MQSIELLFLIKSLPETRELVNVTANTCAPHSYVTYNVNTIEEYYNGSAIEKIIDKAVSVDKKTNTMAVIVDSGAQIHVNSMPSCMNVTYFCEERNSYTTSRIVGIPLNKQFSISNNVKPKIKPIYDSIVYSDCIRVYFRFKRTEELVTKAEVKYLTLKYGLGSLSSSSPPFDPSTKFCIKKSFMESNNDLLCLYIMTGKLNSGLLRRIETRTSNKIYKTLIRLFLGFIDVEDDIYFPQQALKLFYDTRDSKYLYRAFSISMKKNAKWLYVDHVKTARGVAKLANKVLEREEFIKLSQMATLNFTTGPRNILCETMLSYDNVIRKEVESISTTKYDGCILSCAQDRRLCILLEYNSSLFVIYSLPKSTTELTKFRTMLVGTHSKLNPDYSVKLIGTKDDKMMLYSIKADTGEWIVDIFEFQNSESLPKPIKCLNLNDKMPLRHPIYSFGSCIIDKHYAVDISDLTYCRINQLCGYSLVASSLRFSLFIKRGYNGVILYRLYNRISNTFTLPLLFGSMGYAVGFYEDEHNIHIADKNCILSYKIQGLFNQSA